MTRLLLGAWTALIVLAGASPGLAQVGPTGVAGAIEFPAGWAGFVDDARIDHGVFGVAARFSLSPRVSVGPEVSYMIGPGGDRDLFVTANLTFDFFAPRRLQGPRVTPFVVVGGGVFQHSDRFGAETVSSWEGAFTAGGGARIWINDRVYLAPDVRIGWEPHVRAAVAFGVTFPG
jgi:hypothetical protein